MASVWYTPLFNLTSGYLRNMMLHLGWAIPLLTIFLESFLRINYPNTTRPSVFLTSVATFISEWAFYIGKQFGRLTDFYYFLKEIVGDDIVALLNAIGRVLKSPFEFCRGYIEYYASSVTPLFAALIILVLVAGTLPWFFPYYPTVAYNFIMQYVPALLKKVLVKHVVLGLAVLLGIHCLFSAIERGASPPEPPHT